MTVRSSPSAQVKRRIFIRRFGGPLRKLALIAVLVGVSWGVHKIAFESDYFVVSSVEVSGAKTFISSSDLTTIAEEHVVGKLISSVDTEVLGQNLLQTFQGARDISVKKVLPNRIIVTVIERVPLALVTNASNRHHFLVDEQGYVLGIVDEQTTNLPKINYSEELHVGIFIKEDLVPTYLGLLEALDAVGLSAITAEVANKSIDFSLDDDVNVSIGLHKDISKSVTIIAEILKQHAIEGKSIARIDLRYDKVIVEYDGNDDAIESTD